MVQLEQGVPPEHLIRAFAHAEQLLQNRWLLLLGSRRISVV